MADALGPWRVGDRVLARFGTRENPLSKTKWYPGVVSATHDDGACDIAFDDGDAEARVPAEYVKAERAGAKGAKGSAAPPTPAPAEGANGRSTPAYGEDGGGGGGGGVGGSQVLKGGLTAVQVWKVWEAVQELKKRNVNREQVGL